MRPKGDWIEKGRGGTRIASPTSPPLVDPSNSICIKVGLGLRDGESDLGDLHWNLRRRWHPSYKDRLETSGNEDPPLEPPMSRPTDWV